MRVRDFVLVLCVAGVLGGCATTAAQNPSDPWENVNRRVYAFNSKADKYAFKPIAQGYKWAVPLPARMGVSNFFGNIDDVWIGFNNVLQGKPGTGISDFGRFAVNSTVGILGLFDVATDMGIEKHDEDFGQTLAVWGVPDGPYMVLPFFGPSNVRDTSGLIVDRGVFNINYLIDSVPVRNSLTALRVVDGRASLLGAEDTLNQASLDPYTFLRAFYQQSRRSEIYDGHPPREDDFYDSSSLDAEPLSSQQVNTTGSSDPGAAASQADPGENDSRKNQ